MALLGQRDLLQNVCGKVSPGECDFIHRKNTQERFDVGISSTDTLLIEPISIMPYKIRVASSSESALKNTHVMLMNKKVTSQAIQVGKRIPSWLHILCTTSAPPCNTPQMTNIQLAPCHKPPRVNVIIRLQYRRVREQRFPPSGTYR